MSTNSWQELAENGSTGDHDDALDPEILLLAALLSGKRVKEAAFEAGMSERTAYRRISDPDFRKQLEQARSTQRDAVLTQLAQLGTEAVTTIRGLLSSDDEGVRLRAAKCVVDTLSNMKRAEQPLQEDEEPHGRVLLIMPDDGRDPAVTEKLIQNGGELLL